MKGNCAFPKPPLSLEPHHKIFSLISRTLVFLFFFTSLPRSSRCILQSQLTGQLFRGDGISIAGWYIKLHVCLFVSEVWFMDFYLWLEANFCQEVDYVFRIHCIKFSFHNQSTAAVKWLPLCSGITPPQHMSWNRFKQSDREALVMQ